MLWAPAGTIDSFVVAGSRFHAASEMGQARMATSTRFYG
jgi:hypothetical protein